MKLALRRVKLATEDLTSTEQSQAEDEGVLINEDPSPDEDQQDSDAPSDGEVNTKAYTHVRPMIDRNPDKSRWGDERHLATAAIFAVRCLFSISWYYIFVHLFTLEIF